MEEQTRQEGEEKKKPLVGDVLKSLVAIIVEHKDYYRIGQTLEFPSSFTPMSWEAHDSRSMEYYVTNIDVSLKEPDKFAGIEVFPGSFIFDDRSLCHYWALEREKLKLQPITCGKVISKYIFVEPDKVNATLGIMLVRASEKLRDYKKKTEEFKNIIKFNLAEAERAIS